MPPARFRCPPRPSNNSSASRVTAAYGTAHHRDFIQSFTQREAQQRAIQKPERFDPADHIALRQQIGQVRFINPDYAHATKVNISTLLAKRQLYCCFVAGRLEGSSPGAGKAAMTGEAWEADMTTFDWMSPLFSVDRTVSMSFLYWICDNYRIKSWGTSWEYFRQFKQLYINVVRRSMDKNDSKEYHDSFLVSRFGLQAPNIMGKPVGDSGDLLALQTFNIAYDRGIFAQERHRIQLAGIYGLLASTGCRPAELVDNEKKAPDDGTMEALFSNNTLGSCPLPTDDDEKQLRNLLTREATDRGRPKALCYEDIKLMIVRHPETGLDIPAMAIKFIHHKGADSKRKPLSKPSFSSPHVTACSTIIASRPSPTEALQYHKLNDDMGRQSLDSGCEKAIGPKTWRRGAANGNAPDSVRDQTMRHDPKWATFNSAYINELVEFHLQNAFLDEPTEDALIKMLSHIDVSRDPLASMDMVPDEIWAQLGPDPAVEELEQERERLKGGRAKRARLVKRQYREYYFDHRPTWDIEQQGDFSSGTDNDDGQDGKKDGDFSDEDSCDSGRPDLDIDIPERRELARLLCHQPDTLTYDELLERRIQAGECMVALSSKRETARRDVIAQWESEDERLKSESPTSATAALSSSTLSAIPAANPPSSVDQVLPEDPYPVRLQARQCPWCVGDERISYKERTFLYCRVTVRNDHFDSQHLGHLQELLASDSLACNHSKCKYGSTARKLLRENQCID
ncbi:uncharacterized protein L203_103342 [Cryptococcus depauperatus CBS 7841]|uniref:FluG domain-containing protein n=1 Tax=Cryptococcus depauperatus CBS 7841 TaxID=1295531 RepID=A0AAJ8M1Y1_9TREE